MDLPLESLMGDKTGSGLFFRQVALVGGAWIRESGVLLSTQATLVHPVVFLAVRSYARMRVHPR